MYVIRWHNLGSANIQHTGPGVVRHFPADRCTWEIQDAPDSYGYEIAGVIFYDGASTSGTPAIGGTQLPIGPGAGRATFGYIGKSGRFVGMTDENV